MKQKRKLTKTDKSEGIKLVKIGEKRHSLSSGRGSLPNITNVGE
jgi:hypothetical protein